MMGLYKKIILGGDFLRTTILGLKKPLFVSWQITSRCNLHCGYCFVPGEQRNEIGHDRCVNIIDDLRCLGTRVIRFTGGEPLLREDLPELISYCHKAGILTGVASNGVLFPDQADRLKGLSAVSFSLDGPEDVNDALRGEGTFRFVVKAIEAAQNRRIHTALSVTLTKNNIHCIHSILELAKFYCVKVFFQPVINGASKGCGEGQFSPDPKDFKDAIHKLIVEKDRNGHIGNSRTALKHMSFWPERKQIHCVAGRIICRIESDGQLYPCPRVKLESNELNVKNKSIKWAFERLPQASCEECWCGLFVELNLMSRFSSDAVVNAFLQ